MNMLYKSLAITISTAALLTTGLAWAETDTANLDISIIIQPACTLDSVDAVTANHPTGTSGAQAQSGQVRVTCNSGHAFKVAMSAGGYANTGQRRVESGGNYINYDLTRSGGATAWGSNGTDADSSMNTANDWNDNGTGSQQLFGYEVAYTLAGSEPAGTYTDAVLVTLEF
ncbi:Csu type fimbrial protein [Candidatus Venteria ishoeyi]|uniref:Spore coat protein U/FanG domain-containing protein n=1 Tax=Candidatus Venteria ishoeyi TaxID=1899563 RepID=A0A1H6F4D4_9GAMM|nr:spore coat protein U domain-containing protein [Candidatus Venteria ishoeyi]SEH05017.1 Uncharacterised protein [Candidatus Venteria ishoeyi]